MWINETIDPYLWNNDFILVDRHGPIPSGDATVIVVNDRGERGIVEASAPIGRNLGDPPFGTQGLGTACG
jgi:hypothetical protein